MNTRPTAEQLHKAWHDFVDDQVVSPITRGVILKSWQRCRSRLNPFQHIRWSLLSSEHFLATQVASFNLISTARPVMEDIYQCIENSNSLIVLVNSAGYILEMVGNSEMIAWAEKFGIAPGGNFSESIMGTNAFSLSFIERVPVNVEGSEHFLEQFHPLSEAAAPIFEVTGRPLGALGLVCPADEAHSHTLGLVASGALAVMGQIQSDFLLNEQNSHLSELNAILAAISEGIMVWNADHILMHINDTAAKLIGLAPEELLGRDVTELLSYPTFVRQALEKQETLTDVDAIVRFGEHESNVILTLRFVQDNNNQLRWVIATFRQEKEIYPLIQNQLGAQAFFTIDDLAGPSPEIQRVRRQVKSAAAAKACVLIRGEIDTQKNVVASAIHNESQRKDGPFLNFICSAVPTELVLHELVGIEKGTSEKRPGGRPGKLELAQGGTLYIQDVSLLPLAAQAVLIKAIELGVIQRLGSNRAIPIDVRIIASTSADIEKMIAQGNFRADLYYRLGVFEIYLPPLRERKKDIPLLVTRIINRLSRQLGRPLDLAPGVMDLLVEYVWPGNFAELESVLGQAAIMAGVSELIGPMHLPKYVVRPTKYALGAQHLTEPRSLDETQRDAILQAALIYHGNITKMTQCLKIGRTTLWRKLREYHINLNDFRSPVEKPMGGDEERFIIEH